VYTDAQREEKRVEKKRGENSVIERRK